MSLVFVRSSFFVSVITQPRVPNVVCSLQELVVAEVVEICGPIKNSPKKRCRKASVPLDVSLLRRSTRLNAAKKDFRDKASVDLLAPLFEGHRMDQGKPAPPFLSIHLVQGIGQGFCQASPSDLSAKALLESDDE